MEPASEPRERKIALVTGAAQGIGLGIARSLASACYRVLLADIEDDLLAQRTAEIAEEGAEAVGQHLDVTSYGDWERVDRVCRVPLGRARRPGQLRGHQPPRDRRIHRRGALGTDTGDQSERPLAGHQGGDAALAPSAGDDHQHRLDAGDTADAGTFFLRGEQGGTLGSDPAGGRRVPGVRGSLAT